MKINTIRSSWWEGHGYRLDCQPYLAGALATKLTLERLPLTQELRTLTEGFKGGIYNGPQFVRQYLDDPRYGVPFITGSSLQYADLSRLPLLSKRDAFSKALRFLELKSGMSLISCSGTIGKMAYARRDMEGMWSSQDVLKVVPCPAKIPSGYLFAFLRSRFGVPLVVSGTYGAIIQHIEPEHIAKLPVPRLGKAQESNIACKVDQSADLLSIYRRRILEATDKLFSSVGLSDLTALEWHQLGRDVGFEQPFPFEPSFRPLNFSPRFKLLCERIRSVSWKPLGDLCLPDTLKRGGRYRRVDANPEFGYQLIGQKELFHLRPEGRWIARKSVGEDVFLSEGTIAVAAQGTLGESELYCRAEFIWGPWTSFAYSEHMLRVVADRSRILPGCLFAFLRSETAFRMLRSISSGGKLQDNHYYFLPRLPIPVPDRKEQQVINDMVVEAYEMRHRAVALEDEAIRQVEEAIEGAVN